MYDYFQMETIEFVIKKEYRMKNLKNINLFLILATASVNLIGAGEMYEKPFELPANESRSQSPQSIATAIKEQQSIPSENKGVAPSKVKVIQGGYFDEYGNGFDRLPVGEYNSSPAPTARTIDSSQESSLFSDIAFKERLANQKRMRSSVSPDGRLFTDSNSESKLPAANSTTSSPAPRRIITGYFGHDNVFTDGSELGLPPVDSVTQQ